MPGVDHEPTVACDYGLEFRFRQHDRREEPFPDPTEEMGIFFLPGFVQAKCIHFVQGDRLGNDLDFAALAIQKDWHGFYNHSGSFLQLKAEE